MRFSRVCSDVRATVRNVLLELCHIQLPVSLVRLGIHVNVHHVLRDCLHHAVDIREQPINLRT